MRRVQPIEPTASYEQKVRVPGEAFLALHPSPTREQFKRNDFWKEIHDEMYDAYQGICMYCASWTPRTPNRASFSQTTIDHFIPKAVYPKLAYDWSNFRLCRNDINTNKAQDLYVPDPFAIRDDWFQIDFATWRVGPSDNAPIYIKHRIRSAFVRLGLNEDAYIEERQAAAAIYVHRPQERVQLELLYPFLTAELARQSEGTALLDDLRGLLSLPAM
jgi:5-methylcytosine-specific restriction endonuclease McrA